MPHAIFIETNADGAGTVAAYAAELPGCAVFAASDADAASAMPSRVADFLHWLDEVGQPAPAVVGDNWYEVERADALAPGGADAPRRAAFSLDELPPSAEEFERWMGWLELAREELATALDAAEELPEAALHAIAAQDAQFAAELGQEALDLPQDPVDAAYAARDRLTDALAAAGAGGEGVRRMLRIAIADDLYLADVLRGGAG